MFLFSRWQIWVTVIVVAITALVLGLSLGLADKIKAVPATPQPVVAVPYKEASIAFADELEKAVGAQPVDKAAESIYNFPNAVAKFSAAGNQDSLISHQSPNYFDDGFVTIESDSNATQRNFTDLAFLATRFAYELEFLSSDNIETFNDEWKEVTNLLRNTFRNWYNNRVSDRQNGLLVKALNTLHAVMRAYSQDQASTSVNFQAAREALIELKNYQSVTVSFLRILDRFCKLLLTSNNGQDLYEGNAQVTAALGNFPQTLSPFNNLSDQASLFLANQVAALRNVSQMAKFYFLGDKYDIKDASFSPYLPVESSTTFFRLRPLNSLRTWATVFNLMITGYNVQTGAAPNQVFSLESLINDYEKLVGTPATPVANSLLALNKILT